MAWEAYLKDIVVKAPTVDVVVTFKDVVNAVVTTSMDKTFHHQIDDPAFTLANLKTEITTYMVTLDNKITRLNQLRGLIGTKIA